MSEAPRQAAALVTGAGSGIGAACAHEIAASGSPVVLVGRRADRLEHVREEICASGGRAYALAVDLADGQDAEAVIARGEELAGPLGALVHAAGNQRRAPAVDYTLEDFDAVLGLHLRAAFTLSRALGGRLIARRQPGSIVFIGSMTSARLGLANTVAYATAKSGLLGLMRTLAVEWGPHQIRVNTIAVGFVATELTRDVDGTPERRALTGRAPLGRLGETTEVGRVAAFLVSDAASFVTGECLTVDGGWSIA